jgi:hypothetical protein
MMKRKRIIIAAALGVAALIIAVVVLNQGGESIDVGPVVILPPTDGQQYTPREQACIDEGGRLVETPVMNVCVP